MRTGEVCWFDRLVGVARLFGTRSAGRKELTDRRISVLTGHGVQEREGLDVRHLHEPIRLGNKHEI